MWEENHAGEFRWPLDGAGNDYLRVWQGGEESGWYGVIVVGKHRVFQTGPHVTSEAARDAVYGLARDVLIIMDVYSTTRWASGLVL